MLAALEGAWLRGVIVALLLVRLGTPDAFAQAAGCTVGVSAVACLGVVRTVVVDASGRGDYVRIQAALDAALPGDQILVRAGTYQEPVVLSASGTASAPISLQAYPGERPTIVPTSSSGGSGAVELRGSWLVVEGLEVTRGRHGILVAGTHDLVRGNYVHDNGIACPQGEYCGQGVIVASASDVVIDENLIERNGLSSASPWHAHGVYLSGYYGHPNARVSIIGNTVREHGGAGVQVWDTNPTENLLIQRNRLENNAVALILTNVRGVLIQGNRLEHTTSPATDAPRASLLWLEFTSDAAFEGNVFRFRPSAAPMPTELIHLYASDQRLQDLAWRGNTWDASVTPALTDDYMNSFRIRATSLAPPTLVSTRGAANPPALAWFAGAGAEVADYEVQVGTTSGATDAARIPVGQLASFAAVAPEGVQLFVRVSARNASGSALSNEITFKAAPVTALPAPTLAPSVVAGHDVQLAWDAVDAGGGTMIIARFRAGGDVIASFAVAPGTNRLSLSNVPSGTYVVTATVGSGPFRSSESLPVTVAVR